MTRCLYCVCYFSIFAMNKTRAFHFGVGQLQQTGVGVCWESDAQKFCDVGGRLPLTNSANYGMKTTRVRGELAWFGLRSGAPKMLSGLQYKQNIGSISSLFNHHVFSVPHWLLFTKRLTDFISVEIYTLSTSCYWFYFSSTFLQLRLTCLKHTILKQST